MLNFFLQEQENIKYVYTSETISITKKIVKAGNYVYQFRNIAGFGVAEIKAIIPIKLILGLFLLGVLLMSANAPGGGFIGPLMILSSIALAILATSQPKKYGFEISINSGERQVFVTNDVKSLKEIVQILFSFMESDEDGKYTIYVDQSKASIGIGIAETVTTKTVSGHSYQ